MISLGRSLGFILLTLCIPTIQLEVTGYSRHNSVICPPGLLDCTVKGVSPLQTTATSEVVDVRDSKAQSVLCCEDGDHCSLCLVADIQLYIQPNQDEEEEENSGKDEDYDGETTASQSASVTLCYNAAHMLPTCNRVEFTVNPATISPQNHTQLSLVVFEPVGVTFGSSLSVSVQPTKLRLYQDITVPSLDTVCSSDLRQRIKECDVPTLSSVIDEQRDQVILQVSAKTNSSLTQLCLQREENGRCQLVDQRSIPLYSVTTCTCFQVWLDSADQRSHRSSVCPFRNQADAFQWNVWKNISLSIKQGLMNSDRPMLSWNMSAPCRLEGEVWPCHRAGGRHGCMEQKGFRQQLSNGTWRQNANALWEIPGFFEEINLQLSPCVMVHVKGMESELGPFCTNDISRWRWSLFVIAIVFLVGLTVLTFYLLRNNSSIKQCLRMWRHSKHVQTGRGHVVLLSPPDAEGAVLERVCGLGSLLATRGLSVTADIWSGAELCSQGPLPWLHSQLQQLDRLGGRAVLVLTRNAWERAEEWSRQYGKSRGGDAGPQIFAPCSDVLSAALRCVEAAQQRGTAARRFLLVDFESHTAQPCRSDKRLPEVFRGISWFHLPSQTQKLLSRLGAGCKDVSVGVGGRTWTKELQDTSNGVAAGLEKSFDQLKGQTYRCLAVEKSWETRPLQWDGACHTEQI